MDFKKTFYQLSQKITEGIYLCSNFLNGVHILLSEKVYYLYKDNQLDNLMTLYPKIFQRLIEGKFLVPKNLDEFKEILDERKKEFEDTNMYQLIINPTLDCNLSCWYCYENKIVNSCMTDSTIDAISHQITYHYKQTHYSLLKLSFFGGEPFLKFSIVKKIIDNANAFCNKNNILLILDFTTNGTLCNKKVVEYLKTFICYFQITLDGDKKQHNKIKHTASSSFDAFSTTIENIKTIVKEIPKVNVSIRINFDRNTLSKFDSILQELLPLDRKKITIILKKIWQEDINHISKAQVLDTIKKLCREDFVVDYYSQGGICLCDRKNEAVINYDGKIFKCTTIPKFDEAHAMGHLETNGISWYQEKIAYLNDYHVLTECKKCRMFPICGGLCQKKIATNEDFTCFLKNINFNLKEFVLIQFKINLIKEKVYANK